MPTPVLLGSGECPLIPCAAQGSLQLLSLRLPPRVLRLRSFFERGTLAFDGACPLLMVPPCFFECGFSLGDGLLASLALLCPCSLFLSPLGVALPLLFLVGERGLAGCLVVNVRSGMPGPLCSRFFGSPFGLPVRQVRGELGILLVRPI